MTELFAVVGKPVLHSMSPQMHNAAFSKLGIDAEYVRLAAESADDAIRTAKEAGIVGMNVTSPFKDEFYAKVDETDENAERLKAVNTVVLREGKLHGYNTDPDGVAGVLRENRVLPERAVVLGAGGAARAAVLALKDAGAQVTIVNRTHEKALEISKEMGCGCRKIEELKEALDGAGLIISAVSTTERIVPKELLRKEMAVLDANYNSESALLRDAGAAGCRTIDGREWLVYQGVRAFEIFTGKEAPVEAMRDLAREEKGNIALIGFMGCGKNTIAEEIGRQSGMEILDTDLEIERKAGRKISEIFKDGEEAFRALESEEAAEIPDAANKIVNCGGGLVLRNRKQLRNSVVVWLWADKKKLEERIPKDGSRPLLNCPGPEKRIDSLLSERLGSYAEASDIMIDTNQEPQKTAERILYEVRKTFPHIRGS